SLALIIDRATRSILFLVEGAVSLRHAAKSNLLLAVLTLRPEVHKLAVALFLYFCPELMLNTRAILVGKIRAAALCHFSNGSQSLLGRGIFAEEGIVKQGAGFCLRLVRIGFTNRVTEFRQLCLCFYHVRSSLFTYKLVTWLLVCVHMISILALSN